MRLAAIVVSMAFASAASVLTAQRSSSAGEAAHRPLTRASGMAPALTSYLRQTIGLTPDEIRAEIAGRPVVRVLDPPDNREIAVLGVIRINVPRSFYIHRVSDFPSSLRDSTRMRFGVFSEPPTAADVATFSLPHADVEELSRCDTHRCNVKLSTQEITQLRAAIRSNSPGADSIASAYLRNVMLRYVSAYRVQGNAALVVYDDQRLASAAAHVMQAMLSRSPYLYPYAPSLERYLKNYPHDRPAGVHEAVFWSEDDLPGLKPTLSITHQIVVAPREVPTATLIVSKQLYADHYLDGALDLSAVVDMTRSLPADAEGIDLVMLRRWHFDDLPNGGLLNVRGKVKAKMRDQTLALLSSTKASNEGAYVIRRGSQR